MENISEDGFPLPLDLEPDEVLSLIMVEGQESPPISSPLTGSLNLTVSNDRLRITGSFQVETMADCDRCLAPFKFLLASKINELLQLGDPAVAPESEDDNAPEATLAIQHGRIDLSLFLAEHFWLAWPFRHICQPDCSGICPHCGQDRNLGSCSCPEQNNGAFPLEYLEIKV